MYIYLVSKCPTCGYRLLYIATCLALEAVVHDDHVGIRGRVLGAHTMYVAPYIASNMRKYKYSNNNTIYITSPVLPMRNGMVEIGIGCGDLLTRMIDSLLTRITGQ